MADKAYDIADIEHCLDDWGVHALIKLFSKAQYAERFLDDGYIYMQAIGAFAHTENEEGRNDPLEGQASRIMRVNYGHAIYCMTELPTCDVEGFLATEDGRRILKEFAGNDGAYCIVRNPTEFICRFQAYEPSGIGFGLVSYTSGLPDPIEAFDHIKDVPFTKGVNFKYQHEFRITTNHVCQRHYHLEDIDGQPDQRVYEDAYCSHHICLGDLSDIVELIRVTF